MVLDSATEMFAGAAPKSSVTVPVTAFPPTTGFGASASFATVMGRTVSARVSVCGPNVAVTEPTLLERTGVGVMGNVAACLPAATVTVAGTDAAAFELESDTVDVADEARLLLTVTDTGDRRGTEVVQLYAADTATGLTVPAQQLNGFTRVDLGPGASKTVSFVVPMSVLAYTGLAGELVMEPGPVELSAGSSSADRRT